VSWQTFAQVPDIGGSATVWVHTHVREDALLLFGFATPRERQTFLLLTTVPQVGPRLAMALLGGIPVDDLLAAIENGDRAALERVPGIGRRTAERILLDLREKVERLRIDDPASPSGGTATHTATDEPLIEEARTVLLNLGWKAKPVDVALAKAKEGEASPQDLDTLVRRTLSVLMGR